MKRIQILLLLLLLTTSLATAQSSVFRSEGRLQPGERAEYELTLSPGSNVTVRVASVDFQPVIEITTGNRTTGSSGSYGGAVASAQVLEPGNLRVSIEAEGATAGGSFVVRIDELGESRSLGVPETIQGRLGNFDMLYDVRGGYIDWYHLPLSEDEEAVAVTLRSTEFDSFLVARLPDGTELTNDDASGSNSFLALEGVSGTVRIGVTSYGSEATGEYTLSTATMGAARSISIGETVRGTLEPDGVPMERYTLVGEAGDAVELTVSSRDFDTVLELTGTDGSARRNDDAPASTGTDSRLLYLFEEAGQAEITVTAFGGEGGSYTLSVRRDNRLEDYRELPAGARIEAGEQTVQMLGPGDPQEPDGSYYQEFSLRAETGDIVELTLRSPDFDAYLEVYGPSGTTYQDDDSAGGTDSQVIFAAPAAGEYTVRVSSFFGTSVGVFTLSYALTASSEADTSEGDDEEDGDNLLLRFEGALQAADEEPSNVHLFQARQGTRLRIELVSDEFVPSFELRSPSGHILAGAGGVDRTATLTIRIPRDGEYTVIADSEPDGALGSYELSIYEE